MQISYLDINGRQSAKIEVGSKCAVHEAEEIRKEMISVFDRGIYHVLFDLSNCDFMDSTGLGLLVSIHKSCRDHDGKLILFRPSDNVNHLMEITRLNQVFEFA